MLKNKIIKDSKIGSMLANNHYAAAAKYLLEQQKETWPICKQGYDSLETIKLKEFGFDGYKIKIQFNPGRIKSTAAKTDDISIKERKCFLCIENLPAEQKGILIEDNYLLLCNPYPIFAEHYTITHVDHIPQRIELSFEALLSISKTFSGNYSIIYNGPKCGASAPDHMHFQAVPDKGAIPINDEYDNIKDKYGTILFKKDNISIISFDDHLRKFISIESNDEKLIKKYLNAIYNLLQALGSNEEPMLNILSLHRDSFGWRIIIFPREKHRPSHYFREEEEKILLSPASIDIGGLCITPLEKDFNKISKEIITEIFDEVMISKERFDRLVQEIEKIM